MTFRNWCVKYLEVENLTVAQEQTWVENTDINPQHPSSSSIPDAQGNSSSSSSVTRHINGNATALQSTAYECGNPGGKASRRSGNYTLPSCSWDWSDFAGYVTNSTIPFQLRFVTGGGASCSSISDAACTGGEVCGLSATTISAQSTQTTCGTLLGYWTADQICGVVPAFGAPFYCPILYNLYLCIGGLSSCYSDSATTSCCGCADWWTALPMTPPNVEPYILTPSTPFPLGTEYCVSQNPRWTGSIQPSLQAMKAVCPTVYTFPFDDKSSTFVCNNGVGNNKPLDYWIIFCPDATPPTGPISSVSTNMYRTFRFVNKCTYDVWPAIAGGSAFNKATIQASSGQVTTCSTDADCIAGTQCIVTGDISQCFWTNPYPNGGSASSSYMLAANTGTPITMDFHIPISSDTPTLTPIVWSGIMTGRLDCASFPCQTSDCGGSSGSQGCEPSKGFIQPGGQAEFTLQTTSDFYDVEIINGAVQGTGQNFGIEVYPDSAII
jgi:hypothetical protein